MGKKLSRKIALVTGGSAGIARRFAEEGARVFITGRRRAELDNGVAAIGGGAAAIQGDAANLADLDRVYASIREEAGHIDVLAVNAGYYEFGTSARSPKRISTRPSTPTYAACCSRCKRHCHCWRKVHR